MDPLRYLSILDSLPYLPNFLILEPPLYLPQPFSSRPTALSPSTYAILDPLPYLPQLTNFWPTVLHYSVPDLTALYSRPDCHTKLSLSWTNFHAVILVVYANEMIQSYVDITWLTAFVYVGWIYNRNGKQ